MHVARTKLPLLDEICLGALLLMLSYWLAVAPGAFSPISWGLDDAGMYLRYASNAAAGHGIAWNPSGPPTHGLTSLPYFGWIALVVLVGVPSPLTLVGSSWFFGLLGLMGVGLLVWRLSRYFMREPPQELWLHRAFPLLAITIAPLSSLPALRYISLNGMETTLALTTVALLAHSILSFARCPGTSRALLLGSISYLCIAVRPDSFWYVCGCPLIVASLVLARNRPEIGLKSLRALCYPLAVWAGVTSVLVFCDLAAKYAYFGQPLPLSFYTKQIGMSVDLLRSEAWNGVSFFSDFIMLCLPLIAAMAWALYVGYLRAAYDAYKLLASLAWLIPVTCHCLYLISVEQIMGYHGRFYVPGLPFVAASAATLLLGVPRSIEKTETYPRYLGISLSVVVIASTVFAHYRTPTEVRHPAVRETDKYAWQKAVSFMDTLLRKASPGLSVALTEHGYLGARFPEIVLLDLTGLHNPELVQSARSLPSDASDNAAATLFTELFSREAPDLIWLPPPDYVRLRKAILTSVKSLPQYSVFPLAGVWGLAVHDDAAEMMMRIPPPRLSIRNRAEQSR